MTERHNRMALSLLGSTMMLLGHGLEGTRGDGFPRPAEC